jgi:hypothetical protein
MVAHSQAQKADSSTLAVFNTGRNFNVTAADFGSTPTQDLIGEMVLAFDTIMVLKAHTQADSSGKKPLRHQMERSATKISDNLKDKIAVIDYNKDCDVTQTSLNVQRAGAKALIIIHESNDKKLYKLLKKGIYKDSIRIPIYTIPNEKGDKILELLPSMVGIKMPNALSQSLLSSQVLNLEAQAQFEKAQLAWVNNTGEKNDYFIVQRLNQTTAHFEDMETVNNSQQTASLAHYTTYDNQPNEGENIYRIKLVQLDGSIRYSDNKTVLFYKTDNVAVFPNPTEAEVNISFKGYAGQSADIMVYDMQGKSILTKHLDDVQTSVYTFDIGEKAPAGQYMLRIKMVGKKDVLRHFTLSQ